MIEPLGEVPGLLLHQTCIYNNHELLADLMEGPEKDNINAMDAAGRSVVYSAVSNRSFNCLKVLLENGADPNIPCRRYNNQTPLHQAALDGRLDLIKLLLEHSADYKVKDNDGLLPLDFARKQGHQSCAKLLIDAQNKAEGVLTRGVNLRHQPVDRKQAAREYNSYSVVTQFQLKDQLVDVENCDLIKCDQLVSSLNMQEVVEVSNSSLPEDKHTTILYRACMVNRVDVVKWLIDHGATASYDEVSLQTPLYRASHEGHTEVVKVLLKNFPHLIKVVTSSTAGKVHNLHLACTGSLDLLRLIMEWRYEEALLEYHYTADRKYCYWSAFDVNVANFSLWSPLYMATVYNKPEHVRYLLQYEVMGYPLSSAFSDLSESDIPQALNQIEDYRDLNQQSRMIRPVDVEQMGVDSLSPLHYAVKHGCLEVARLLIEHKADVNRVCEHQERGVSTPQKYTPLKFAVRQGDKDMISLLLRSGAKDENSELLGTCLLENNTDIVRFMLKHHAHIDTQHKILVQGNTAGNFHMILRRGPSISEDHPDAASFTDYPVSINWRSVNLPGAIDEDWIYECSHFINPHLPRDVSVETITQVDVSDSSLASLPSILFSLKHLVSLNAQSNKLTNLPSSETWNLPNLKELLLDKNNYPGIPEGVFHLLALEKLSMSHNRIKSVQFSIYLSPKLSDINLSHNLIDEVAHSRSLSTMMDDTVDSSAADLQVARKSAQEDYIIVAKPELTGDSSPAVRNSSPTNIPKSTVVNHWSNVLVVVDTFDNPAQSDASLTSLNLSYNKLKRVPQGLPCLAPRLQKLDLSNNQISEMGSPLFFPYSLNSLNLSHNKIDRMVRDYDEMDELTKLAVKSCYSCTEPTRKHHKRTGSSASNIDATPSQNRASIGSMTSLSSLANTQLCSHKALKFDCLTILNLSYNRLTELKFAVYNASDIADVADNISEKSRSTLTSESVGLILPRLAHLDLSHNNIVFVPSIISEQADLSQLNLRFNLVRDLPPEMGLLKNLWNMELNGCPLEGSLAEMVQNKSKTSDILGFLKSVLNQAKPYASMKLMIVGQANIGKTTLLAELRKEGRSSNPFKHFNQRVHNTPVAGESRNGDTVSTVGVDIGDLTLDRSDKKGKGKVVFKTWDFGGQEEYYATHQYFLSKRSLYLVLFKLSDGEIGLRNIKQWLVNIQTRSPGAPVIIVGSHFDLFKKNHRSHEQKLKEIEEFIETKYMINEAAMSGLPNVRGFVVVSSRTKHNIGQLCNRIYDEAWALRAPGSSTTALLNQKIPAIYIQLEQVVSKLAKERVADKSNPVLNAQEYRALVKEQIAFRDDELNQATQFLHDNGILLHYHDVALNDLYFLDPQWLCDMLAHVISIKEINRYVKHGIMERKHLHQLFGRSSIYHSDNLQTYIISLLNKFELALVWDHDNLMLPSLLPSEQDIQSIEPVKIPLIQSTAIRRRATINSLRKSRYRKHDQQLAASTAAVSAEDYLVEEGKSTFYLDVESSFTKSMMNSVQIPSLENSYMSSRPHDSIRRIYFLSYIPSGFWPRLISRIYRDQTISILSEFLFDVPKDYAKVFQSRSSRSWQCWKTGLSLQYLTSDLLKVKEVHRELSTDFVPYYQSELLIASGRKGFSQLDVSTVNILEVEVLENIVEILDSDGAAVSTYYTNIDIKAKLLAKVVEHIETLLEDWYPDLGEKFQHTARGKYLVQRLVVCPACLERWSSDMRRAGSAGPNDLAILSSSSALSPRKSLAGKSKFSSLTMFSVERLLKQFYDSNTDIRCRAKHTLDMAKYAPDLIFADIYRTMQSEDVILGKALGKGAFGVVFVGTLKEKTSAIKTGLAVKSMQPHDPGEDASDSLKRHYEQAARKWNAELSRNIFTAYCNARQEINILSAIQHPHIVSLVGVLLSPLSLLLDRAPCGSLQDTIEEYSRDGLKIPFSAIQQVVVQIAQALDYLHNNGESQLIYRDLKAENVLVWSMTSPHINQPSGNVDVRLADFGVSRAVSDNTAKGIRGTPGYIAPEILEFQGTEQYTNKVDCYSFGSFLYELITLKRPFHNADGNNISGYVLAGKHPSISFKELLFPTAMLDLMIKCWSYDPKERPSAEEIALIASNQQFCHLQEAVKCDMAIDHVTSSCLVNKSVPIDMSASVIDVSIDSSLRDGAGYDVYVCGGSIAQSCWTGRVEKLEYGSNGQFISTQNCELPPECTLIICCAAVGSECWLADRSGYIHILKPHQDVRTLFVRCPLKDGPIKQLLYAERAGRVFCLLQNGWLIEYDSSGYEEVNARQCNADNANCMVLVDYSLWVGGRNSMIYILPIRELTSYSVSEWMSSNLSHTHSLSHYQPVEQFVDTAALVTDKEHLHVWSSVYPGSIVFKWDVRTKSRADDYDLSHVVKQYQSCDSVSTTPISSLTYHCNKLLVTTTSGYLIILEAFSMRSVLCIPPHPTAPYKTIHSVLAIPGLDKYLTVGIGYKNLLGADSDHVTADPRKNGKPPVHVIGWYIDPNQSL